MGGLCACISDADRKEEVDQVKDGEVLAIQPLVLKLQPIGENQGTDIEKLLDSYTRDLLKFIPSEIEGNERVLIVIFGAYVQKIREVVFKEAEKERHKALNEKDWKKSRGAYKKVIASMFASVQVHVEELFTIAQSVLKADKEHFFKWISMSNFEESEIKELELEIKKRALLIKIEAIQWGEKRRGGAKDKKDEGADVLIEQSKCREIMDFIEFIQREQIYFDSQPWDKEQSKNSFGNKSDNGMQETDQSGNNNQSQKQSGNLEFDEIIEISMHGFEIEDRVYQKYEISLEQFKQSYQLYFLDDKLSSLQ